MSSSGKKPKKKEGSSKCTNRNLETLLIFPRRMITMEMKKIRKQKRLSTEKELRGINLSRIIQFPQRGIKETPKDLTIMTHS